MKEYIFIKKNKVEWKEFESFLNPDTKIDPDHLAQLFIKLTDDLAYSKTFYPHAEVTKYLNQLSVKAYQKIYKTKKKEKGSLKKFWAIDVPQAVLESHKELFYAFLFFVGAIALGFFSTMVNEKFPNLILGTNYVNTTIENIEAGNPMGIYGDSGETGMFLGISSNNIRVSFMTYVLGVFGSFGSAYMLVKNGIMVGTFLAFFLPYHLFWLTLSTIFIHGALELSAIVIAGGAGIVLGNSILFPGTYSRSESFRMGAKKSIKIIIGLVPVWVMAAILESFVTRHYLEMGGWLRSTIILISFGFIIWYFVIYPKKVGKKLSLAIENEKIQTKI